MSDTNDPVEQEHRDSPYANLSNSELIRMLFVVIIPQWFLAQFPLASLVEDGERFVGIQVKERAVKPILRKGDRRVLIDARRIPLIIAGRRISYVGFIIGFAFFLAIAVIIRTLLS